MRGPKNQKQRFMLQQAWIVVFLITSSKSEVIAERKRFIKVYIQEMLHHM